VADDCAHHISPDGLAALEAELRELETEGRRAIAERIRTAREWGGNSAFMLKSRVCDALNTVCPDWTKARR
jgi:transcription elongation factor-like protein